MNRKKTIFIVFFVFIIFILGGVIGMHKAKDRLYSKNLIAAIEANDHQKLEQLLKKNGNVDAVPYSGFRALFLEVFNDPPLFYAIRNGDVESVRFLLEYGADANIVSDGYTPLMAAGKSWKVERFEIAHLLIDYSADVNKVDKWGLTPVLYFNANYNPNDDYEEGYALFLRFVSLGAIPSITHEFYYGNFLLYAVSTNNIEIIEYLIHNCNYEINTTGRDGTSALIRATIFHATDIVEYLIENGVTVSLRDNFGKTALDYAIENNYTDIISLLDD